MKGCNKLIIIAGEGTLYSYREETNLVLADDTADVANPNDPKWQAQELALDYILNRFIMDNEDL